MSRPLVIALLVAIPAALQAAAWWAVYRRPRVGASLRVALSAAGLTVMLVGGTLAAFWLTGQSLEHHAAFVYAGVAVAALVAGSVASRLARRVAGLDLVLGALPALHMSLVAAYLAADGGGVAAASWRVLFIATPTFALLSYFGASVGYLLWGSGRVDLELGYESLVGRRFLLSKASPVLSTVTAISVVGVSLGVCLVIVVLAILGGFESDLMRKIIGANAHVVVQRLDGAPFQDDSEQLAAVSKLQGVTSAAPFVQGEVAVASSANHTGSGMLVGVDLQRSPEVLTVLRQIDRGSLEALVREPVAKDEDAPAGSEEFAPPARAPGVVIGVEMARQLAVSIGDKVRVLSPLLEVLTPVGVAPKSVGFEVVAVFDSKMYEYDAHLAFVTLDAARTFFELGPQELTGFHVRVDDPERSDLVAKAAVEELGTNFEALDWKGRNQTLFAALELERVVAFIVLAFIILVASFSIVNTLTMSVIEKRKEIAILKTMGAHDIGVMKVFLTQGMLVGGVGTLLGAASAMFFVWILKHFKLWIPEDVYYIDALPVHLEPVDVVLVALAALLIVWNFAVFPALHGSKLLPVDGLRDG